MCVHVSHPSSVRTTIEISEAQRGELLKIASSRERKASLPSSAMQWTST
jgi:hypothetical protein